MRNSLTKSQLSPNLLHPRPSVDLPKTSTLVFRPRTGTVGFQRREIRLHRKKKIGENKEGPRRIGDTTSSGLKSRPVHEMWKETSAPKQPQIRSPFDEVDDLREQSTFLTVTFFSFITMYFFSFFLKI